MIGTSDMNPTADLIRVDFGVTVLDDAIETIGVSASLATLALKSSSDSTGVSWAIGVKSAVYVMLLAASNSALRALCNCQDIIDILTLF